MAFHLQHVTNVPTRALYTHPVYLISFMDKLLLPKLYSLDGLDTLILIDVKKRGPDNS